MAADAERVEALAEYGKRHSPHPTKNDGLSSAEREPIQLWTFPNMTVNGKDGQEGFNNGKGFGQGGSTAPSIIFGKV